MSAAAGGLGCSEAGRWGCEQRESATGATVADSEGKAGQPRLRASERSALALLTIGERGGASMSAERVRMRAIGGGRHEDDHRVRLAAMARIMVETKCDVRTAAGQVAKDVIAQGDAYEWGETPRVRSIDTLRRRLRKQWNRGDRGKLLLEEERARQKEGKRNQVASRFGSAVPVTSAVLALTNPALAAFIEQAEPRLNTISPLSAEALRAIAVALSTNAASDAWPLGKDDKRAQVIEAAGLGSERDN